MNKLLSKIFVGVIIFMLLSAIGIAFLNVKMFAYAAGPIYINSDGSINPPTAPIDGDGTRYWFTNDISGEIVVLRNNIIIGGHGYKLTGSGSGFGFSLTGMSNVTIVDTEITNFTKGIVLDYSSNCRITTNKVRNNTVGISLYGSMTTNNTVVLNLIMNNSVGVEIDMFSESNTFYGNTFFENGIHTRIWGGAPNSWSVIPIGGNYWDNYTGVDLNPSPDGDGAGDTPHVLAANNVDQYPLMGAITGLALEGLINGTWTIFYIGIVSNSSEVVMGPIPEGEFEMVSEVNFNVTGPDGTIGFSRVSLPHQLLEPPYAVTINDNPVTFSTLYENETLSMIYFTYTHSTHEVSIVPDFNPLAILPFVMIATLFVIVIGRKTKANTKLANATYCHYTLARA
jgi:parallel beta-helix repeat protein